MNNKCRSHTFFCTNKRPLVIYGNVIFKTKEKYLHKKSNTNVSHLKKHMVCSHQAVFMKKNILQDLNGFDLRYHVSLILI